MKNTIKIYWQFLFLIFLTSTFIACEKEDNKGNSTQVLVIENGAINTAPDQNISYKAALIDVEGNRSSATNVQWSSSDNSIVNISSNGLTTIAASGNATITAKVEINGTTLTATAPIQVQAPSLFAVSPSAILVDNQFPNIELTPIYLGTQTTSYTYSSSNTSVVTVSASGEVHVIGVGNCQITVTATGLSSSFIIPVSIIAVPTIKLPIVRVVIHANYSDYLKTETEQYTAKAYDLDGNEVNTTFQWSVEDNSVATIDANALLTATALGKTKIRAMASGVIGSVEINVHPNKVLVLDPYYTSISAGNTKTFTAMQHPVVRTAGELTLGAGVATTNVNWSIPTYGFSIFDIATVNNTGTVTIKSNAQIGLSTMLLAEDKIDAEIYGVSSISVAVATNCSCGTATNGAAAIQLTSPANVSLSLGQTAQIQATVVDANGVTISGANLSYCSADIQVADVDATGEISATAFTTNSTTITVCHGNLSKTITVNIP